MVFSMSGNLLRFCNFRNEIEVQGETIEQGVDRLVMECPGLRPVLLDGNGKLRGVHRIFRNGDIVMQDELAQPCKPNDEISILTAIAGG